MKPQTIRRNQYPTTRADGQRTTVSIPPREQDQAPHIVMCEVSGGVTGYRRAPLRKGAVVQVFPDFASAHGEASRLMASRSPHSTASFKYEAIESNAYGRPNVSLRGAPLAIVTGSKVEIKQDGDDVVLVLNCESEHHAQAVAIAIVNGVASFDTHCE